MPDNIILPLQINTYQAVLTKSGNDMFAIYLYADGLIQWTTGDYSKHGINGFGGSSSLVGYEFKLTRNGARLFYDLPGSL